MGTTMTATATLAALLVAGAAAALTAGEKCEADKLKTAGKYAFCRLNADSKGIKKGLPPDYSKCDEKYGAKWALVESKAGGAIWTWAADLNTASFAGATDWRIPTRQELEGILDLTDPTSPVVDVAFHGASCGIFCTDPTSAACSCTSPANWSATTYAPNPANAWTASFNDGGVVGNFRATGFWVRAVRGGS